MRLRLCCFVLKKKEKIYDFQFRVSFPVCVSHVSVSADGMMAAGVPGALTGSGIFHQSLPMCFLP